MAETVHLCNIVVLAVSAVLAMFAGGTVPPAAPPPPQQEDAQADRQRRQRCAALRLADDPRGRVPNPRHRGATGSGGSGQEMYWG